MLDLVFGSTPDGTVYDITGPADAPAVVLVHGLGLSRATFDQHLDALSERYRVIRYDLFGHGESADPKQPLTLTTFSEQIVTLLDELDVPAAAVVGFSLGGMINRRLAIDHPNRVTALAVLNSPHERTPEAQQLVEQRALDTAAGGPGANIETTLARWFTEDFRTANPGVVEQVRSGVVANRPEPYAQSRFVLANGVLETIRPEPPLTVPTLVMTCENDTGSTPAMSQAIASETAGAELIIVPRLQHLGLLEQPDTFTDALIDFLDRVL